MESNETFYEKYWDKDKAAPEGDPTTEQRVRLLLNVLRKELVNSDKISILDAGCGHGYFTSLLQGKGYHTVGIDISDKAIEKAKRLYPEIDVRTCSLEDTIPFEDKMFNMVWSTEVIEHIYYVHTYLHEMNRVLKPDGFFILTTPYHGIIKNLLVVLFGFERHFCNIESGHIRFFTNKGLKNLLNRYGFEVIQTKYIGRIPIIAKSIFMVARKVKDVKS